MLTKITAVEAKLFFREPGVWLLTILLPTFVLVVVGLLFGGEPDPALGGLRWIDIFAPSMVVMTLAILGVNTLPARLVKYREKGVLRRLSTTPASPRSLLIAQLIVNMGVAVVSLVVLIVVGNVVLQIPLPQDPIGFAAAFMLGMSALFALGLLVAAVAPTTGIATALFAAAVRCGDVPRWGIPPTNAAAGVPDPHR